MTEDGRAGEDAPNNKCCGMEEDENIDEYFQVGVEVGGEEIEWPDHSRHVILIKFL